MGRFTSKTSSFTLKVIALGVLTAIAFWFLDSAIDSSFAPERTFIDEAFSPELREILKRSILMLLILLFSMVSSWRYTRRLRAGRRLLLDAEEQERKYRDLFENASDAIFVLDTSFSFIDINRAAEEMLGFTREQLLEMNVFDLIPEEQAAASLSKMNMLEHSGQYKNFQGRLRTKDCMWLDVEISSTAIVEDGRVVGSRDIVRDITERKIIMDALEKTIREKDMLLREIHHRAKNNLTVVQSLLYLQSTEVEDSQSLSALKESQERLGSISLIHSMLSESEDVKNMDMSEYVTRLSEGLMKGYRQKDREVDIIIDADRIYLDIEQMMPCGLILNELITNALKYAFTPGQRGRLKVFFKEEHEGTYVFGTRDNGVGIPEGMKFEDLSSLGIKIIITLTDQLRGDLKVTGDRGTEVKVTFKALPAPGR